jgi:hypothetical protein
MVRAVIVSRPFGGERRSYLIFVRAHDDGARYFSRSNVLSGDHLRILPFLFAVRTRRPAAPTLWTDDSREAPQWALQTFSS